MFMMLKIVVELLKNKIMTVEKSIIDKKLTVRELLTIRLIQFMIKVIKPSDWEHEFKETNEHIDDLLKKG